MKTDRYTKFILTVIAIGLIANLIAPFLKPTPAIAQTGGAKKWKELEIAPIRDTKEQKDLLNKGFEPFAVDGLQIWFRK